MIPFEDFEQQWLEEVRAGEPSTTELGHRFAEKILRDWHEIDASSSEIILCDGAGDGGIDAAIFIKEDLAEGVEGDTWILVQSKYGTAYSGGETISVEAQKLFATLEGKRDSLSSMSKELVDRLRNFIANSGPKDRLEYVLATNRKLSPGEQEYLQNIKVIGRSKFDWLFDVDAVSIETIYNKLAEEDAFGPEKINVKLRTNVASAGDILLIGAAKLTDIYKFMNDYRIMSGDLDLLYEKNVRKFLGSKKKVNKGIEQTIESHPERFGLYNNGITIVVEDVIRSSTDDSEVTLVNPFIVNGCQTTRSIWSVLQRRLNSGGSAPTPEQTAWETRLGNAVAVTKIVVVGTEGDELLTETTRYTNSQNTVGEKDFIALEKDFRSWAPAFNSRFGVFLEIQRGAWEARKAYQRQHPLALPKYAESANAFELLKAYAAGWLCEPGIAYGKNPPFAPGGTLFNKIVNEPEFGVESLYAAHLMQKLATGYGFGRGAKQPTRGQTRYLFIMVAVDLVKDILINSGSGYGSASISKAIIALDKGGLLNEIGEAALQLVDDYLTDGNEDCLFNESEFNKLKDLNAFLKSDKLGKGDEFSPLLRTQMSVTKKSFRKSAPIAKMRQVISDYN
ncbi:AIPR family protein [Azospirillum formosense]|uniref:AIPR family protein n=1 Tax=Azospirillum formosense TaxID=861533 RepID=UPI00338D54A0